MSNEEEVETVQAPPEKQGFLSKLMGLVRGLKPGDDMTHMELSSDFCLPESSLMMVRRFWMDKIEELLKAESIDDPIERAKQALRMVIASGEFSEFGKKPLNPVLGEVCAGYADHTDGSRTFIIIEQISHHPPICGLLIVNEQHQLRLESVIETSVRFWGKHATVSFRGYTHIHFDRFGEMWDSSMPTIYFRVFRWGQEYVGPVEMTNGTLTFATDFKAKPLFGGKWHALEGTLTDDSSKQIGFYQGVHWGEDAKIFWKKSKSSHKEQLFFERAKIPKTKWKVVTTENPNFSENIWGEYFKALSSGEAAGKAKAAAEKEQRRLRKEREENNVEWKPTFWRSSGIDAKPRHKKFTRFWTRYLGEVD